MFGKNKVVGIRSAGSTFLLHSMFYTIQGEGPWAGMPTIFVRFAGCNLRCAFCDTEFEQGAEELELPALMAKMLAMGHEHNCYKFVLTGGEPMLQPLPALIRALLQNSAAHQFQIETAGTVWPAGMDEAMDYAGDDVLLVCSPKTPVVHRKMAEHCVHWKYIVIAGEMTADGWPICPQQGQGDDRPKRQVYVPQHRMAIRDTFYMQPCDMPDDPEASAANMREAAALALAHGRRLSIQLHKVANLP